MKKDLIEIIFILDKSGSMAGLEQDTIGGFNSVLKEHKQQEGEAIVSTILFDTNQKVLHDRVDIREISELTYENYRAGGCTALLDAVGRSIKHISNVHKYIRESDVPEKTIFVITTDGYENSSREFTYKDVSRLIEQKKKKDWEFIFLGANIDAISEARRFGIMENRTVNCDNDSEGIKNQYECISDTIKVLRKDKIINTSWDEKIKKNKK